MTKSDKAKYKNQKSSFYTMLSSLSGRPLEDHEFVEWIQKAEKEATISLEEARGKWAIKKLTLSK